MMKTLAILRQSGHGHVVADAALSCGWDEVVFDDALSEITRNRFVQVRGNSYDLIADADSYQGVAVAVGDNEARLKKIRSFLEAGLHLPALIHGRAYVALDTTVASGCVVLQAL